MASQDAITFMPEVDFTKGKVFIGLTMHKYSKCLETNEKLEVNGPPNSCLLNVDCPNSPKAKIYSTGRNTQAVKDLKS